MARPKGSRNQATIDREEMAQRTGQTGPAGEPDPKAMAEIDKANRAQAHVVTNGVPVPMTKDMPEAAEQTADREEATGDLSASTAPALDAGQIPTIEPIPAVQADFKAQLKEAFKDPSVAMTAIESVSTTPEGRALLNLQPGQGMPSGEMVVDYHRTDNWVMGGVEVEHGPGFTRLPPGYIFPYLDEDGRETHYAEPFMQPKSVSAPMKDDDDNFIVDDKGRQIWHDEIQMVLVDKGAAKDAHGRPIKTETYKRWLDATHHGGRFDADPSAASTAPAPQHTASGAPAIPTDGDGAPVTVGAGVEF